MIVSIKFTMLPNIVCFFFNLMRNIVMQKQCHNRERDGCGMFQWAYQNNSNKQGNCRRYCLEIKLIKVVNKIS